MPRFDGTGPKGMGSRTGKGLGNCDNVTEKEKEVLIEEKQILENRLKQINEKLNKN